MSDKQELIQLKNRCYKFLDTCKKDLQVDKPYWDKEVDSLISSFFHYLREEIKKNESENRNRGTDKGC